MTPREVLALCREKEVKAVDLRFCDLLGTWQHVTIPVGKLDESVFEEGQGIDASSLRGWQSVHESDMLVVPDSNTALVDPTAAVPTLALIGNIQNPVTGEPYSKDPRHIAAKAANFLKHTGIADEALFGPEPQFYVFDTARFDVREHESYYHVSSHEGEWTRGAARTVKDAASPSSDGHKLRHRQGYSPCPPADQLMDLRSEMMQAMIDSGLDVQCHHHAIGSGGQCAIDVRHQPLVKMADGTMIYKHCVKNVARRSGRTATFMPQPLSGDNGSGMHIHFSLWKDGEPLFAGGGYAGLSEMGLFAVGGILRHAPALLALTNPTTNSYKRLVPGYDAPVHLVYSQQNRSAACRIPMYSASPKARRLEFRCPDPTANPYLAFAAITMAAIDGIQLKLSPGQPTDRDLYRLSPEESADYPRTPGTLDDALRALEADHEFLLKGDVFTPDVIASWIEYKRRHEVDAFRLRPHPYEFCLYFDA